MAATTSSGNTCSSSHLALCGAISCSANSRTTLRKASCSGEKSKSINHPVSGDRLDRNDGTFSLVQTKIFSDLRQTVLTGALMEGRRSVTIRDCGPRDGLQGEAPLGPTVRAQIANSLVAAGLPAVEAAAFVSARRVPAMAGASEVVAPDAGGNLATEELVLLFEDIGTPTGVDLDALLDVSHGLGEILGRELPSRVTHHGALPNYAE